VFTRLRLSLVCAFATLFAFSTILYPIAYGQLTQPLGVKITSPVTGQQVQAGPLTISGTSSDTSSTECTVFADWNDKKPMQKASAVGPRGPDDYSLWRFTYSENYHLITEGSNELTAKLSCAASPANMTKYFTVNVTGVADTTNTNQTDQQLLPPSTTVDKPPASDIGSFPPSTLSLSSSSSLSSLSNNDSSIDSNTSTGSNRQEQQQLQEIQQQSQQSLPKPSEQETNEPPTREVDQPIQQQQQEEPQSQLQISNSDNDEDVKLLSSSDYKDELGFFHVIGELENNSPDSQQFIKVTSRFYDSSNKIVGTSFTYTDIDVLRPGEKSPFDIILNNRDQSDRVRSYKLAVSSDNSEPKLSNLKLTIGDNYYDDLGYTHVLGEVTNQGNEDTQYAKISGTFYNDQNKVVGVGFTFTDPSDLEPGESAPFDLLLTEHASDDRFGMISSGSLNVQSQQYAMILPATIFSMDGDIRSSTNEDDDEDDENEVSNDNDHDNGSSNNGFDTEIDVDNDPIVRGNKQSFTVKASDRDTGNPVEGAQVDASVDYAGPHMEEFESQATDDSGDATFSWTIGGNSNPGIFTVIADVSKDGYRSSSETSSFEVMRAADEVQATEQATEICDDGENNDDDGSVDSDPDCPQSTDPCIEDPELPQCQSTDPCIEGPELPQCQPIDPCEDNPDLPQCIIEPIDPCEEDPEAEGCEPSPDPPIDPCEEDPDSEVCGFFEPEPSPDPNTDLDTDLALDPESEENSEEDNQGEEEEEGGDDEDEEEEEEEDEEEDEEEGEGDSISEND
jgi:hypothetical protein